MQALTVDKGDTAWMLVSTILVLMMVLPGLALFYGGLVRAKNMLSILSQVLGITARRILVWVGWGYSLAFAEGTPWSAASARPSSRGIDGESVVPTFTAGVGIPELVFAAFQMTFAAITASLIVGALAERVKFAAIMLFTSIWLTIVYAPLAHMVWAPGGLIFAMGALDFAGGTVVHVNSGVAGLVGVYFAGKRIGFLKEATPPHSLAFALVGAGLLWVGWFGFNAGSALEASGARRRRDDQHLRRARRRSADLDADRAHRLGQAVAARRRLRRPRRPRRGHPGRRHVGPARRDAARRRRRRNLLLVRRLGEAPPADRRHARRLRYPRPRRNHRLARHRHRHLAALGGYGAAEYSMSGQLLVQAAAVVIAILWSAAGSALAFWIVKRTIGLRVERDQEREGLDLADHGERAYNY